MLGMTLRAVAVPIALAATMPVDAAVDLAASGPIERSAPAQVRIAGQKTYYSRVWYSTDYGKLVVTAEGLPAEFDVASAPDTALITARTASILADPMSWAMMTVGLAAIGWTMRSRLRVTDISFI